MNKKIIKVLPGFLLFAIMPVVLLIEYPELFVFAGYYLTIVITILLLIVFAVNTSYSRLKIFLWYIFMLVTWGPFVIYPINYLVWVALLFLIILCTLLPWISLELTFKFFTLFGSPLPEKHKWLADKLNLKIKTVNETEYLAYVKNGSTSITIPILVLILLLDFEGPIVLLIIRAISIIIICVFGVVLGTEFKMKSLNISQKHPRIS